jgi:hypothetical protein
MPDCKTSDIAPRLPSSSRARCAYRHRREQVKVTTPPKKRDSHKLHLLQAIAYAGMVAKWPADRFIDEFAEATNKSRDAAITELEEFLDQGEVAAINQSQRVILLAEEFDYEVLVTAEWLYSQYEVDIRCYRLSLASSGDQEFLTCVRLYPPSRAN